MFRSQSLTPFALSLALHAGVLLLVLVGVSRDEPLPALIIDLRDPFVPGAASVASPPREERPAPPPAARSRDARAREEGAAVTPPAPPALTTTTDPPRGPAPETASSSRADAAPLPTEESVGSTPSEPAPRGGGDGSTVESGDNRATVTERGSAGGAPITSDHGATGRSEPGGSSAARVAVAPSSGAGSGAGAEYGPYLTALRERIQQSVRYPASARRRGLAGTVGVEILILANGTIGDVTLLESSSHAVLDDAALDTIRALPRMPLPPELPARPLRVRVPVVFQLR
jgi:periplasmic protein TonB